MKKTKTIFVSLLTILLAAAVALGLAACGESEETDEWVDAPNDVIDTVDEERDMTNDDVETLSTATTKTLDYEDSYTVSADIFESYETGTEEQSDEWMGRFDCSYDSDNCVEYIGEAATYSDSDEIVSERYEEYVVTDEDGTGIRYRIDKDGNKTATTGRYSFELLSSALGECSLFSLDKLKHIYNTNKLESVILDYASNLGYKTTSDNANVKMKVSGSTYTLSASFETGYISIVINVRDGLLSKISMYGDRYSYMEATSDIEISYSYKSSLASNFSNLDSFE